MKLLKTLSGCTRPRRRNLVAFALLLFFPLVASAAQDRAHRASHRNVAPPRPHVLDLLRACPLENSRRALDEEFGLLRRAQFLLTRGAHPAFDRSALDLSSGSTEYGFQSRERDSESGLQFFRARSYDPMTGRFTSRDPVPHANLYSFVFNNPVNVTDPSGQDPPGQYDHGYWDDSTASWEGAVVVFDRLVEKLWKIGVTANETQEAAREAVDAGMQDPVGVIVHMVKHQDEDMRELAWGVVHSLAVPGQTALALKIRMEESARRMGTNPLGTTDVLGEAGNDLIDLPFDSAQALADTLKTTVTDPKRSARAVGTLTANAAAIAILNELSQLEAGVPEFTVPPGQGRMVLPGYHLSSDARKAMRGIGDFPSEERLLAGTEFRRSSAKLFRDAAESEGAVAVLANQQARFQLARAEFAEGISKFRPGTFEEWLKTVGEVKGQLKSPAVEPGR